MKQTLLILAVGALAAASAQAQFSVTGTGTNTIDFNSFAGDGLASSPVAGQLNSNIWRVTGFSDGDSTFGGNSTTGDFARGTTTGGVTTGGLYAFDLGSSEFAAGFQPGSSDFTPGTFTFRLSNDTGLTITEFAVDYDIIVFNDQGRSNTFNFAHSADDVVYTDVGSADFTSNEAADASPAFQTVSRSVTISGLNIANGDNYFFQWQSDDFGGSGSRDELGLDNLAFSATVVPEPSTYAAIAGMLVLGLAVLRRRK